MTDSVLQATQKHKVMLLTVSKNEVRTHLTLKSIQAFLHNNSHMNASAFALNFMLQDKFSGILNVAILNSSTTKYL